MILLLRPTHPGLHTGNTMQSKTMCYIVWMITFLLLPFVASITREVDGTDFMKGNVQRRLAACSDVEKQSRALLGSDKSRCEVV